MSTLKLRLLNTRANGFAADFERLLDRARAIDPKIETTVRDIVADVRARGDAAVVEYTRRFDRREVASVAELAGPRRRRRSARWCLPRPTSAEWIGCSPSAVRRRSRHSLTARRRFPRWTRLSVREMCMSPPPSGSSMAWWTST